LGPHFRGSNPILTTIFVIWQSLGLVPFYDLSVNTLATEKFAEGESQTATMSQLFVGAQKFSKIC